MENIRFSVLTAAFAVAVFLLAPPAHADQITVFSLTTVFQTPPQSPDGTASGTITIDTTTGVVEAIDLSFAGGAGLTPYGAFWNVYGLPNGFVEITEVWPPTSYVEISLPVSTLVGYTGGSICTEEHLCDGGAYSGFTWDFSEVAPYSSGQLTATPEPASLILFGTGVLGLVGILRRKL